MSTNPDDATRVIPLLRRFPALARLPRAPLGTFPTALERGHLGQRPALIKRDDRSGNAIGGNKVRGLEFLLGGIRPGDEVLTVGPRGSTHALATARYGRQLGARVTVVRWNQAMNPAARRVDALLREEAIVLDTRWVPAAYVVAGALRLRARVHWIPAGGASPLAMLGHVNAALELAEQLSPETGTPDAVFVPFGTGGTAAGIALGLRIAGLDIPVHAVRVVPRVLGRAGRLLRLASEAARLIERLSGTAVPRLRAEDIRVDHGFYAGGYGTPFPLTADEDSMLAASGLALDDTYCRKAFGAAVRGGASLPLLWVTFDGRLLQPRGHE